MFFKQPKLDNKNMIVQVTGLNHCHDEYFYICLVLVQPKKTDNCPDMT